MANNELLKKMDDIISNGLDELDQHTAGTDDFAKVLGDVARLHKLRVEELKLSQSQKEQDNKHDLDKQRLELDKTRAKDDTTDKTERRKFDEKRLELEGRKIDDDANDKAERLKLEKTKIEDDENDKNERRQLEETRMENDERYRRDQLMLETRRANIEDQKLDLDRSRFTEELNSNIAQREDRRIDRYLTIGMAVAELLIPLGVYTGLALLGFGREFDGVITSDTLKRVWNNIKPAKK